MDVVSHALLRGHRVALGHRMPASVGRLFHLLCLAVSYVFCYPNQSKRTVVLSSTTSGQTAQDVDRPGDACSSLARRPHPRDIPNNLLHPTRRRLDGRVAQTTFYSMPVSLYVLADSAYGAPAEQLWQHIGPVGQMLYQNCLRDSPP